MVNSFSQTLLNLDAQVTLLQSRGLVVSDIERAKRYLLNIGYHRLSAYCLPFESDKIQHSFSKGATFDDILDLYVFDRKLRGLLLDAIERIECSIKSVWAYKFTISSNSVFPHLDKSLFKDTAKYNNIYARLEDELYRSSANVTPSYFQSIYQTKMPPLWSCVSVMSFGELINWIDNVADSSVKKEVATTLGFLSDKVFMRYARSLLETRNTCAHHARLWNKKFTKRIGRLARSPHNYATENFPLPDSDRLYPVVLVTAAVLKGINPNSSWPHRFNELLKTRTEEQKKEMGFGKETFLPEF